ncbi:MAG: glycoside hydrolase domain-containing protein [Nocardioides sp.]
MSTLHLGRPASLLAALVAALLVLVGAPSSSAAERAATDGLTGYAFDARCAPTQAQMDAWLTGSPFWGAGIYLGGSMRSCGAAEQTHLDATWVQRQTSNGWRLLPIWVGPQASCSAYTDRIDPEPAEVGSTPYGAAEAQGRDEAAAAVATAQSLGLPAGNTLWYDLEDFDVRIDDCRRSALRFLSAWTLALRQLGYRSGVYSSAAAGIHALDNADNLSPGSYAMPDQVWFAWYNNVADTQIKPEWVRANSWARQRAHQYAQNQAMTFGGVTLTVDPNYVDLDGGSVAPAAPRACGGVRIDFGNYPTLARGKSGAGVKALQCLLKQRGKYRKAVDGRYDADVVAAVRSYQRSRALPVTGRMVARTWVSLLSHGAANPLLKEGSAADAVRRLQRALNVATAANLRVTGVFDRATSTWVRRYQQDVGLSVTGVVAGDTWDALRRGRR